ncbi:MAG: type II toxin-antitoxin system HicA family toxin [Acidimicrobiaceae bacterium]|nr:type II toxin-antitoxin system HicA family toxin [Acidimicrobiaceae bacterium]MXZ52765.1 type II toxin-antitoxin system HicA family toxin [Acidimicrobiaceae bacterium]MYI36301.1 type II toxin-antitoxin system HicA family toxin [Acidimicrobiaceae bacterium]
MPPTVREAIRVVESDGWYLVRTNGSHRHFRHPLKPGTVTIPGSLGKALKKGTWGHILRRAGLK